MKHLVYKLQSSLLSRKKCRMRPNSQIFEEAVQNYFLVSPSICVLLQSVVLLKLVLWNAENGKTLTACKPMSTGQLLHHCSALITSASYSATLTAACKMKSWTSPKRGHLMPPQDSLLTSPLVNKKSKTVSVKRNCWRRIEKRWADIFTSFWGFLIWHQQRNVVSCTVLVPTAIFSWKLNALFLGLLVSESSEVWLLPTGWEANEIPSPHRGTGLASQDKHLSTYSTWAKWAWQAQRSWPGSTRSQDQQARPWWQGRSEVKLGR